MANNKILEIENSAKQKDPDLKPIHPGEILREEFLIPLGIESEELAKNIGVGEKIIKKVIEGEHNIDLSLSYRLGLYFDLRDDYWWDLQKRYELDCWIERKEKILWNVLPQKLVFQSSCWQLDHQILKNMLDKAILISHGK